jgi:hypothetical protein
VARAASTTVGSFNLDLNSPNNELGLLLNFLESNSLGRVVSSRTILVAAGQNAAIEPDQIARVPGPNILDADNRSVLCHPALCFGIEGACLADINFLGNHTIQI